MISCYFLKNHFIQEANINLPALIINNGSSGFFFAENINFLYNFMKIRTLCFTGNDHSIILKSVFAGYNTEFALSFRLLYNSDITLENHFHVFKNQICK